MNDNALKIAITLLKCEFALKVNVTETVVIYYDDENTSFPIYQTKFDMMSQCTSFTPFCSIILTN